jgi:hypothetical protein
MKKWEKLDSTYFWTNWRRGDCFGGHKSVPVMIMSKITCVGLVSVSVCGLLTQPRISISFVNKVSFSSSQNKPALPTPTHHTPFPTQQHSHMHPQIANKKRHPRNYMYSFSFLLSFHRETRIDKGIFSSILHDRYCEQRSHFVHQFYKGK